MKQAQNNFPKWYWTHGLHDAQILSVSQLQLTPDYKEKNPRFSCFEIELDGKQALFERNIKKICLYNYKIKSTDFDVNLLSGSWWISDEIQQIEERYLLNLEIDVGKRKTEHLEIMFQYAEVIRK